MFMMSYNNRNIIYFYQGLLERLKDGGSVVCAEGYLWELERRGFLQFGNFLPEVVLEKPKAVEMLHEEFALAGSDVIEAFTVILLYISQCL